MEDVFLYSHHGGFLAWDSYKHKLIISDFCYDGVHPIFVKNQKLCLNNKGIVYFLTFVENQFLIGLNLEQASSIKVNEYATHITINNKDNVYLTCTRSRNLSFAANKVNDWERFYFKNKRIESTMDFNKDIYVKLAKPNKPNFNIPKIIWMYWDGDVLPLILNCIERVKKINPDFQVEVLNKSTLHTYVKDKDLLFYLENHIAKPQLLTDLLRLYLLKEYGGIWLDASIILNVKIEDMVQLNTQFDLQGFYFSKHFQKFGKNDFPLIENWFLAAPKNSALISQWFHHLSQVCIYDVETIINQLKDRTDFEKVQNSFTDSQLNYFLAYLIESVVLIDNPMEFNIYARCADYSALYYHCNYGWSNIYKFRELLFLKHEEIVYLPKLIKLCSGDRIHLHQLNANNMIDKTSYLGRIING